MTYTQDYPVPDKVLLKLFIAGYTPRSQNTIRALRQICDKYHRNGYELQIIDIYQQPELAYEEQIVATPTLVRIQPMPKRMLIGDLTQLERVLSGLGWV